MKFVKKKYIEEHGDPDIIQIRKTFIDGLTAREWESKVLTRINATIRKDYLNKWARNIAHPELSSANLISLRQNMEFETKRQFGLKQYNDSAEARQFRSNLMSERNTTDKARDTSRKMAQLRNSTKKECPGCNKQFNLGNFSKHINSKKCQKEKV